MGRHRGSNPAFSSFKPSSYNSQHPSSRCPFRRTTLRILLRAMNRSPSPLASGVPSRPPCPNALPPSPRSKEGQRARPPLPALAGEHASENLRVELSHPIPGIQDAQTLYGRGLATQRVYPRHPGYLRPTDKSRRIQGHPLWPCRTWIQLQLPVRNPRGGREGGNEETVEVASGLTCLLNDSASSLSSDEFPLRGQVWSSQSPGCFPSTTISSEGTGVAHLDLVPPVLIPPFRPWHPFPLQLRILLRFRLEYPLFRGGRPSLRLLVRHHQISQEGDLVEPPLLSDIFGSITPPRG